MSDMKSKNNKLEATDVVETSTSKGGVSKWIWLGVFALAFVIGVVTMGLKSKPLQLDHLVEDVAYDVIEVVQSDYQTIVEVVMDEEEEQVVEVIKAISTEVKQHPSHKNKEQLLIHVYKEAVTSPEALNTEEESELEIPCLDDENHTYTAVVEQSIKLYQLKDFSSIEANILATDNWYIENSKYEEGHLTGRVVLLDEVEEELIYAQLKAVESEMIRFNEVKEDKETYFYTPAFAQTVYGYSSVYPNHLIIEKEIVITVSE